MASMYMPSGGYVGSTPIGAPSAATRDNAAAVAAANDAIAPVNDLRAKTFSNLGGALRGELPQDVTDQIARSAAEFGVASGMPGSEFASYQGLRNLGLTSLSRMQHAEDLLTPHFFQQSPTYVNRTNTVNPTYPMDPAFRGTNSAPLLNTGGGGRPMVNPETGVKTPDSKSIVGDFLQKYLPGGNKGVSTGMAPMGSGTQPNYSAGIPFFGSGVRAAGATETPGYFAGTQEQYGNRQGIDQYGLGELADQGIIDPAFGEPDQSTQDYLDEYGY